LTVSHQASFVARVILHHATSFGTPEHWDQTGGERERRSVARADAARRRISGWLENSQAGPGLAAPAGLVLTGPAAVAWATGGVAPPVDRTAAVDLVWAVFTPGVSWLITTNVEAERVRAEYDPAAHGFAGLAEVPWFEADRFVTAAAELAGAAPARLASDGHQAFGSDAGDDLISLRLQLSQAEIEDLAELGADAAHALQSALTQWRPGERDLDVQARCAAHLEAAGADAPVLIVGGDDRLTAYRHPMAAGVPVKHLVMAVTVARRAGLHVALTRFASAGPLTAEYAALRDRVLAIEDGVLAASKPGATYGEVLEALASAYSGQGAINGWEGHYQGGPIGFAQREFEIAPGQAGSRWYGEPVAAGHAIAWNPSLPGGAKAEDTYLIGPFGQLSRLTEAPGWPAESSAAATSSAAVNDDRRSAPPAVLEVGK
jgi:Xaa-Pro dipeptidase